MNSLIRGFIFRCIFTGVQFCIGLLIAKFAGTDQFGVLSLMIVNAALIQIITGLGSDAAIVWHGISGFGSERNKIYSFTIFSALIQLLLFALTATLFYLYAERSILSGGKNMSIFMAEFVYFTGLIAIEKYSSLYYSQQQAILCNSILAIASLVLFFLLFILYLFIPDIITDNIIWIFSFYSFLPAAILFFFYTIKYSPTFIKVRKEDINSFVSFSFIVFISNLIQFFAYRCDYWIINWYHEKGDVGIYALVSKFAQILWIIPGVLAGLIIPALKNEKNKLSVSELLSICRLLFFTHVVLAVTVVIGSFLAYKYFLPVEYSKGLPSLLIMIPGYILFISTTILAAFFSANRLLKINLRGAILCFFIMITLDLLLIPKLSYSGAAIANLAAYSITSLYFIFVSFKFTGGRLKDYFILRREDWNKIGNYNFKK